MAVFSKHHQVLEPEGEPMTVGSALDLINQALDEVMTEQEGDFDSDTRWAVAWFEAYGLAAGPYRRCGEDCHSKKHLCRGSRGSRVSLVKSWKGST